jgi:hypothetical protein
MGSAAPQTAATAQARTTCKIEQATIRKVSLDHPTLHVLIQSEGITVKYLRTLQLEQQFHMYLRMLDLTVLDGRE